MYLLVRFEKQGNEYLYYSPLLVKVGQIVLVNVYGEIKAVTVTRTRTTRPKGKYDGPIKTIVGVGYLLEELETQAFAEQPQSLLQRILG